VPNIREALAVEVSFYRKLDTAPQYFGENWPAKMKINAPVG
jgi:hypothetical protein